MGGFGSSLRKKKEKVYVGKILKPPPFSKIGKHDVMFIREMRVVWKRPKTPLRNIKMAPY